LVVAPLALGAGECDRDSYSGCHCVLSFGLSVRRAEARPPASAAVIVAGGLPTPRSRRPQSPECSERTARAPVHTIGDLAEVNTADHVCSDGQGHCSLRAAIEQVNADRQGTPETIQFSIGPGGTQVISPTCALPTLTSRAIVDASTQSIAVGLRQANCRASTGYPCIELSGANVGGTGRSADGLHVQGGRPGRGLPIFRTGTTQTSALYTPTVAGIYRFRALMRNGGGTAAYSPVLAVSAG